MALLNDSAVAMISSRDEPATWIGAGIIRRHMHRRKITLTPVMRLEQR